MENIILYTITNFKYWSWVEYKKRQDGFYDVIYGHEHYSLFCEMCGSINFNCKCEKYKIVTYEEVKKAINNWNKKGDMKNAK